MTHAFPTRRSSDLLFFFLVGLEVKHEFTLGELTDRSRAMVPIAAAVAGLAVPAGIFLLINASSGELDAWGVVISTDTAFLLGALAIIEIGRAHVWTPVTNAHLVCRLLLEKK